ncbi:MAG: hypothetical protein K2G46_04440 [Bacteroidales bacterium]|nr:hypothetical protein [Bacteroidales bacterium]
MEEATSKEKILKDIREALTSYPIENPYPTIDLEEPVATMGNDYPDALFAENFVRRGGKLIYCENVETAVQSLQLLGMQEDWSGQIFCGEDAVAQLLDAAGLAYSRRPTDGAVKRIGCCSCLSLFAQTGSVLFDAATVGRRLYAGADLIIFFATMDQIVQDEREAFREMKEVPLRSSSTTVWTGLSKLTDIDGESRPGFGPGRVILFLIDRAEVYVRSEEAKEAQAEG